MSIRYTAGKRAVRWFRHRIDYLGIGLSSERVQHVRISIGSDGTRHMDHSSRVSLLVRARVSFQQRMCDLLRAPLCIIKTSNRRRMNPREL